MDDNKRKILERLRNLETEYNIRILLAVESGSRAYGCASDSSDYDIRFIYVYPMERYLRLSMPQDSISIIEDDFDLCGWELRRALSHASKSNATFWEWMQSPIILDYCNFSQKICEAATPYFYEKPLLYAERGLINSYRKEIMLCKKQVKNSLGLMRVAMQALYVMQYHTAPPVSIETLIDKTNLKEEDKEECNRLLELCQKGQKDTPYILSCELASNIDNQIQLQLQKLADDRECNLTKLDQFFQSIVCN